MHPRFLDTRDDIRTFSPPGSTQSQQQVVADGRKLLRPLTPPNRRCIVLDLAHWAFVCAAIWAMIVPAPALFAASQTWNGNGGNSNWSTGLNWNGGAAPGSTAFKNSTDTATFNDTGNLLNSVINIDSLTQDIGSITFDLPANTTGTAYTIGSLGANSGNTLFLSSGGTVQMNVPQRSGADNQCPDQARRGVHLYGQLGRRRHAFDRRQRLARHGGSGLGADGQRCGQHDDLRHPFRRRRHTRIDEIRQWHALSHWPQHVLRPDHAQRWIRRPGHRTGRRQRAVGGFDSGRQHCAQRRLPAIHGVESVRLFQPLQYIVGLAEIQCQRQRPNRDLGIQFGEQGAR